MLHLRVYENPGVRTPHPPLDPSEGRSVPPWRTQPKHQNFLIANSTAVVRDEKRQGTGNCAGFCSSGAQLARSGHSSPPSRKVWGDSVGLRFGSRTKARFYAMRARGVYKHMKRRRRVPFKSCFNLKIHKVSRPIHRRARGGAGRTRYQKGAGDSQDAGPAPPPGTIRKATVCQWFFGFLFVSENRPP